MKHKRNLKLYSHRVLAYFSAFAMLLPLLTYSAQAEGDEGLTSGDITAQVVNGQVPIFKWTAIHDPKEIPAGTHYIMALTELDTVWHNSDGFSHSSREWQYYTDTDRSFIGNRKYSSTGHQGDVFYTVGSYNPIVICYTPMAGTDEKFGYSENKYWDPWNNGPSVTVWTTKETKNSNGNIVTSLTPLIRSDEYWGNLYDVKSFFNTYYKSQFDEYNRMINQTTDPYVKEVYQGAKERIEYLSLQIENFAQKIANGESPLAKYDSFVSHYAIGMNEYNQKGNFDFTHEVTGDNPSLRIDTDDDSNYYRMIWGEGEGHWNTRAHFNLWLGEPTMFSTLTHSYEIGSGNTLSLNAEEGFDGVYIPREVTLTVKPGGTLSINETVYNDGTIINDGGTVIIQKNGRVSNLATDGKNEIIVRNGDFIIMPGGALYTNSNYAMVMGNSRLINFGTFIMGGNLMLYSSFIENRRGGVIAGNLRFGNNTRYRRTFTDGSGWVDFDIETGEVLGYSGQSAVISSIQSKPYTVQYGLPKEKKDWTPYFAGVDLSNLRDYGSLPSNMVWYDGASKIYLYDIKNYNCIESDTDSYMRYLKNEDTVFIKLADKTALENKINDLVSGT